MGVEKSAKKPSGTAIDVQAVLPCKTREYFVERDSAAFRSLLAKSLKLGHYRFGETWEEGDSIFVRLVTKPEIGAWVPSAVRNAVSSAAEIEFHDIIEYRPSDTSAPPYRLHVRTESPFLGKRLEIINTLTFEPHGVDGTATLQRLQGVVRVRMLGIGRIVEHIIRDSVSKTYKQLPEIIARWEAFREEAVRSGKPAMLLEGRPPVGGDLEYVRAVMRAPYVRGGQPEEEEEEMEEDISSKKAGKQQKLAERAGSVLSVEGEVFYDALEDAINAEGLFEDEMEAEDLRRTIATDQAAAMQSMQTLDGEHRAEEEALPSTFSDHGRKAPRPPVEVFVVNDETEWQFGGSRRKEPRVMHPSVAAHRRGVSVESVESVSSEAPADLEERVPGTKGARKAWKHFNKDYERWDRYWAVEVGVKAVSAARQGMMRIAHVLDAVIRSGLFKVVPAPPRHRRSLSAPEVRIALADDDSTAVRANHARHVSLLSRSDQRGSQQQTRTVPRSEWNGILPAVREASLEYGSGGVLLNGIHTAPGVIVGESKTVVGNSTAKSLASKEQGRTEEGKAQWWQCGFCVHCGAKD